MRTVLIETIEIDDSGRLLVAPSLPPHESYEQIYREANGLRWDREQKALVAYEPHRWQHAELLQHIVNTLRACNEQLQLAGSTRWLNVPSSVENELRKVLAADG